MVGLTLVLAALAAGAATTGEFASRDVVELSGLAQSRADPAVFWGHNDTGDGPMLYRAGAQGEDYGRVAVPEARAVDWEDIAAFEQGGRPALLIADTGDNLGLRTVPTLYAVRDPGRSGGTAALLWRMDFDYPDGTHDSEAVAVDAQAGQILLLTKRDDPPRLYALPLPQRAPQGRQHARLVGTLALRATPPTLLERLAGPISSLFLYAPTAMDISADGLTAVVVTPRYGYRFHRRAGEDWARHFATPAPPFELPSLPQVEAAALSADGRTLWIGSEGSPGTWARLDLPGPDHPAPQAGGDIR